MAEDAPVASDFLVNNAIKDFCFDLHDATRRSHLAEDIERLYTVEWKELGEKFCDKSPWPSAQDISSQCIGDDGNVDEFFLRVYSEMALRHLFAKLKPTLEDRITAWQVYSDLFAGLEKAGAEGTTLCLSAQWVFDIMHEFVYQFQSFCQFRTANSGRSESEKAVLEANRGAWAVSSVLERLQGLVRVSGLRTPGATPPSELHHQLGYFAIVTMSRLECLLGDYGACVELLQIDCIRPFDELSLGSRVFACRITVLYHLGFALLMMQRYRDSICVFNSILSYLARIAKTGGGLARFNVADQVQKNHDRMLALLAVALALSPGVALVDDAVLTNLKDKYADKVALMNRGDVPAFNAMLTFACPKFVVPSVPNYSVDVTTTHDAYKQQLELFTREVTHQQRLSKIRSYLKLYTSIDIEKLARFNDVSPEEFRAQLVGIKQKMRAMAAPLDEFFLPVAGASAGAQDLHFYVHGEMLHVDEPPTELRHDEYFASEILKYDHVLNTLHLQKPISKQISTKK